MASSSRSTTTAASTRQYRETELTTRAVYFRKKPFCSDRLPASIRDPIRACEQLDPEASFEDILTQQGASESDVANAKSIVDEVTRCLEDAGNEDVWTRNLWSKRVYPLLDEDHELMQSANSNWDAALLASNFRLAGLGRPKPDIAYGFKVSLAHKMPHSLLSDAVLGMLENARTLDLHPRPSPTNLPRLAYPAYVHEVKPANGTQQYVENQLARSVGFALDQQIELRRAAAACCAEQAFPIQEDLPVVGVTSIGEKLTIFFALEGKEGEANIIEYASLDLSQPRHAYASILFVRAVSKWLKTEYRTRILTLLRVVCSQHQSLELNRAM